MNDIALSSLIRNIVILLIYSVIYDFYWIKYRETGKNIMKYATGILVGGIGISLMQEHLYWFNNVVLDSRTVLLCLTGLFFGYVPTVTATICIIIFRVYLGGPGLATGIFSSVMAASVGLIFNMINPDWLKQKPLKTLITTGIISHICMIFSLVLLPDGNILEILWKSLFVILGVFPAATVLLGWLMVHQAARWNLKDELQQSEERFNKVAICTDDCFWETDAEGHCTFISKSVEKILGYKPKDLIGKTPYDIVNDNYLSIDIRKYAINDSDNDKLFNREGRLRHKDGSTVYVKHRSMKTYDKLGKVTGYIGVFQDISDIHVKNELIRHNQELLREQNKKYESLNAELTQNIERLNSLNAELTDAKINAENADKIKTDFITNISHEIHTPVTAINGFIQLLTEPSISKEEREKFLRIISKRSSDLLGVVNDILDISRIQSGKLIVNETIGNITDVFNELYDLYKSHNLYVNKKPVKLIKNIDIPETERIIKTDFVRLKQILMNFISNAYRYTDSGTIKFICTSYNEGKELCFEISDTGMGLTEAGKKMIFERYQGEEVSQSGKRSTGTELSLSISKELTKLLGGRMWFDSTPNEGTTFYFTIPYKKVTGFAKESSTQFDWSGKNAIILENDSYTAIYISENLIKTGIKYTIITGENRSEYDSPENDFNYDIMIIDDKESPVNFEKAIKYAEEKNPMMPVIGICNENDYETKANMIESGCRDFIGLPISGIKMLQTIAKHIT